MEAKQRTILQQGERIGPDPEVPEKPGDSFVGLKESNWMESGMNTG